MMYKKAFVASFCIVLRFLDLGDCPWEQEALELEL
jgi:hypothetical protein